MPTVQLTPESACRRYGYADHRNQQVLLLFGFDLCCHLDVNKYMYSFMSVNHFVFFSRNWHGNAVLISHNIV